MVTGLDGPNGIRNRSVKVFCLRSYLKRERKTHAKPFNIKFM